MRAITREFQTEETKGFYHWLKVFGLTVQSILNPASTQQADDFREEAAILDQTVVEVDGNLVAVK